MELWIQIWECLLQRIENENDEPVDEKIIGKVMLRRVDLANLMCSPPKKFEYNDA